MTIRINYFSLIFVLLIIFASCQPDQKTKIEEKDTLNNTKKEIVNQEYYVPANLVYELKKGNNLSDLFYPIGWSKDGKFAYAVEPADEATGFYFFNFIIFDSKTNKEILNWKIDETDEKEGLSIKDVWNEKYNYFKDELKKYNIAQEKDIKLEKSTFSVKNNNYEIVSNIKYGKDSFGFGLDVVKSINLSLKSIEKQTNVFTKKYPDSGILKASVSGIIKSPYENKIIIILEKTTRGWEGPPHVISFEIAGLDLEI